MDILDQTFNMDAQGNMDPNDKCVPKFFYIAQHMKGESEVAGRPIFKQVAHVEILIPGGKHPVTRRVIEADKTRWPRQWYLFEKMGENKIEGTPIEEWPQLTVIQTAILKSLNILTVEAVSTLDAGLLPQIGQDNAYLKDKAILYLKQAKDSALVEKLTKRVEELEKQLADKPETNIIPVEKKRRGRPPKVEA